MQPVIVEEHRAGQLENAHQGIICVINERKEVVYERGDSETSVYYRSALKPIQAIPAFMSNVKERYNLTTEEAALLTASQRGEKEHEKALEGLLNKLEVEESLLICHASYPLNDGAKEAYIREQKSKRKLLHNCAGKHLGFIAYAKANGLSIQDYADPAHPLQQEILQHLMTLSETPRDQVIQGFDGCGAPVYSIPLKNMAISYLKLGLPSLIEDQAVAKAVEKIGGVMNAHPTIVASEHFICAVLLEDDNIIAKGGAQGVYCLTLKEEKLSIALKILSGSEAVWPVVVADLLEKLKYKNKKTIEGLRALRSYDIVNDSGTVIGETIVKL